jgi:DNA replication protein DnaD
MNGYIKLWRDIEKQPWYNDSQAVHLFLHILLKATHVERQAIFGGKVVLLEPGQFVTGRNKLSAETGINRSKIERCLKLFEACGQIEQRTSSVNRCISVVNYVKFQKGEPRTSNERVTKSVKTQRNPKQPIENRTRNEQQESLSTGTFSAIYEVPNEMSEHQMGGHQAATKQQMNNERAHNKNEKNGKNKNKIMSAMLEKYGDWIAKLKSDEPFREQIARQHQVIGPKFDKMLDEFIAQKNALDELKHPSYADFRRNFMFWIPKSLLGKPVSKSSTPNVEIIKPDKYEKYRTKN